MALIWFLIIGLLAGLIARALMPGEQHMGIILTMVLGIVGSFVGGIIGSLFGSNRELFSLRPSGLILSIVGALIVLIIAGAVQKRRGGRGGRVTV
jgi:uncharacterized membrane protein YeaQ/YmgE (transglycosylase-associated protein family)